MFITVIQNQKESEKKGNVKFPKHLLYTYMLFNLVFMSVLQVLQYYPCFKSEETSSELYWSFSRSDDGIGGSWDSAEGFEDSQAGALFPVTVTNMKSATPGFQEHLCELERGAPSGCLQPCTWKAWSAQGSCWEEKVVPPSRCRWSCTRAGVLQGEHDLFSVPFSSQLQNHQV